MISSEKKHKPLFLGWKTSGIFLYILAFVVGVVGAIYLIWSSVLMIQSFSSSIEIGKLIVAFIFNFLSLLVEIAGIFYTVMLIKHMGSTCMNPPVIEEIDDYELSEFPEVSFIIPIRNPDPLVLEKTLDSISKLEYPREKVAVYLGDDTDDIHPDFKKIRMLANEYSSKIIYDPSNVHFKAGMLKIMLKEVKSDYFILLDYDHVVQKDIVKRFMKAFQENPEVAFVQAKVSFRNVLSKLQVWESVMYAQFYEVFQRSKTKRNTVLTNGSTVCFRKSFVDDVGGIPYDTLTEDVDISVSLLTKGYKTVLVDSYGSFGLIPATFSLLLSQILRWAKGSMQVLKRRWKRILRAKLPFSDRLDLLFSTSLFLIAASVYLNVIFYVIMYLTKSPVIRVTAGSFPPLLIMPIAFAFSYQISGIIAVLFARRSGIKSMKPFDLVYFLILALVLNPFTIFAVFKSFFSRRIPIRGKDEWNEKVSYLLISFVITLLGGGLMAIAVLDLITIGLSGSFWLVLGLLGLSMVATFPVCLYLHLTTKHNKPYFVKDTNAYH
ncbi:MAG: glycosyltransferase [Candidatus Heimdallarchaeota archaeon]|nr:glycosyltransferase [Candidatus Heimdallarchaeota archaeon]